MRGLGFCHSESALNIIIFYQHHYSGNPPGSAASFHLSLWTHTFLKQWPADGSDSTNQTTSDYFLVVFFFTTNLILFQCFSFGVRKVNNAV